jgi:hypothetical protein
LALAALESLMTVKSVRTQHGPQHQSGDEYRAALFILVQSRCTSKRLSVTTLQIPWIGVLLEKPAFSQLVKLSVVYNSRTLFKKKKTA